MKTFLIAGATAAGAAVAQPAPYAQPQFGGQRDGVQTRNEVVQRVQGHFARIDVNRDGFVTREEAQAGKQLRGQRMGQRGARQANPARRADRQARAFDRLDLNNNGVITRDEFTQARTMRGERGQRVGQQRGGMRIMRGALHGRMFAMADFNRDNRVSLQEATGAAVRTFDMVDVNRDGRLTREERQQMRQRFMQNRGARG